MPLYLRWANPWGQRHQPGPGEGPKRAPARAAHDFPFHGKKSDSRHQTEAVKHGNHKIRGKKGSRRGSPEFLTALYSF